MANEIRAHYPVFGSTLYGALLRMSDGQVYNGAGFEPVTAARWPNYGLALTEQDAANGTGFYYGNMPAVADGLYEVWIFRRSGASPVPTDSLVAQQGIDWAASKEAGVTVGNYAAGKDPYTQVAKTTSAEGYAAKGVAPTFEQFMYMIWSALAEFKINGSQIVSHKLDTTTTSMTWNLDDPNNPQSRTRAT